MREIAPPPVDLHVSVSLDCELFIWMMDWEEAPETQYGRTVIRHGCGWIYERFRDELCACVRVYVCMRMDLSIAAPTSRPKTTTENISNFPFHRLG
jgi:hypothetical protein